MVVRNIQMIMSQWIRSLRDENGIEIDMAISDSTLYDKDINEGDWVYFDPNNQIFKEN